MSDNGDFKVRSRSASWWVSGLTFTAGLSNRLDFTPALGGAVTFGPGMRPFFEAMGDDYEIVPEPEPEPKSEPFRFPPTPWTMAQGKTVVMANDGLPVFERSVSDETWAEIVRRVNRHEHAENELRFFAVVSDYLSAKIAQETLDLCAPIGATEAD